MQRRTPIKRTAKPLRRTPLARVSKKRRKENREYLRLREGFMASHPHCEVCVPNICQHRSTDVHHAQGRGINLCNVNSWVSVCRPCHEHIHQHPSWARENGYLAK